MVALTGVMISVVAMVVYTSTVQRSKPSTEFVNAFNSKMSDLERKVDDARTGTEQPAAAQPSVSTSTIIDRPPVAATIIDLPSTGDTLTVRPRSGREHTHDLPAQDVTIGRDAACFIAVDDGKVSGTHLRLAYKGGTWFALDMNSTNGTYLNGRRLGGQGELVDGDVIKLGDTMLVFGSAR